MTANNYTWVCFGCRFATRQAKTARRTPKCGACGDACFCVGYKVEIPAKRSIRGWRALRDDCINRLLASRDRQAVARVRTIHSLEKQIARLRALGPNKGRAKEIARLESVKSQTSRPPTRGNGTSQ